MSILITGGSGYLGELLANRLQDIDQHFISVDLLPAQNKLPIGKYYQGNICDKVFTRNIFNNHHIEYIFHFATQIDFDAKTQKDLYKNNVLATQVIAEFAKVFKIKKLIFTSSNSIFLGNSCSVSLSEKDVPIPIDAYGKSKITCEKIFHSFQANFDTIIFRCPNIIDGGRAGMLSILFEFVKNNKICWQIGNGDVKHQCIYAQDLLDAMLLSLHLQDSHTFHIGSHSISTIKEINTDLILHANSSSKIKSIPKNLFVPLLKLLYKFGLSPLGPYQFRMLTSDFSFNISHIMKTLNWQPTLSNSQMLIKAYDFYVTNIETLNNKSNISANKSKIKMGIINLVKIFS